MLDSCFDLLTAANRILTRVETLTDTDRDKHMIVLRATEIYAELLACLGKCSLSESDYQRVRSVMDRIQLQLLRHGEQI